MHLINYRQNEAVAVNKNSSIRRGIALAFGTLAIAPLAAFAISPIPRALADTIKRVDCGNRTDFLTENINF